MKLIIKKFIEQSEKTELEGEIERKLDLSEDYIIECKQQISNIKVSDIPTAENNLVKAERELKKAKDAFETARFAINDSFEDYIYVRNEAKRRVSRAEDKISSIKNEIDSHKATLKEFEAVLKDLTEEVKED